MRLARDSTRNDPPALWLHGVPGARMGGSLPPEGHVSKPADTLLDLILPRHHRGAWALVGATIVLLTGLLWLSPASPAALGRADAMLGRGDADRAAKIYDAVAVQNPWPASREEALYRGALVYALDLGDTDTARKRLHRLVEMGEPIRAADGWEQIGHLRLSEDQPRAASRAFRNAWEVAPEAPRASKRLQWAARSRYEAGDVRAADRTWRELAEAYPDRRGFALLARAELRLAEGDAEAALSLYEQATEALVDPHQLAVAHLGVSACLERLGDLDGALAAIEIGDLPADVLEVRRQSLRTRSALSNGAL